MSLLASQNYAPAILGRVLVLGLGASGKAIVRYCVPLLGDRVQEIVVYAGADDDSRAFLENLNDQRIIVHFDKQTVEGHFELGVASPGISEFSSFYQQAHNACNELIGEVEFAWRESRRDAQWIAVTGTNGKTTTTALTAHILKEAGLRAQAVGNIGDTCIEAVMRDDVDVFVAEVSSYQLASTKQFAPQIAMILNITPDHLSWHKSLGAYRAAKKKVYANMGGSTPAVVIVAATDEGSRALIREIKSIPALQRGFDYIPLGTAQGIGHNMRKACGSEAAAYTKDDVLVVEYDDVVHQVGKSTNLQITGIHNQANALAAASAAVALGVSDRIIQKALVSFEPLEHRIEPCGTYKGVSYFNDSKATNTDAVIKALSAFNLDRLVVLVGGSDKGTDLTDLAHATQNCKAIVCFGAAGPRLKEALTNQNSFLADSMEAAVHQAQSLAQSGDAVLLSPACASFDEFDSFEHRGTVFKQLVAETQEYEA